MGDIFVIMRAFREQLILDVDAGNSGRGELAYRAHRVQRLAETRSGIGRSGSVIAREAPVA